MVRAGWRGAFEGDTFHRRWHSKACTAAAVLSRYRGVRLVLASPGATDHPQRHHFSTHPQAFARALVQCQRHVLHSKAADGGNKGVDGSPGQAEQPAPAERRPCTSQTRAMLGQPNQSHRRAHAHHDVCHVIPRQQLRAIHWAALHEPAGQHGMPDC